MKARKLPSGSWNVQVVFTDGNGNKRTKSFTAPTRETAEYDAAKFRAEQSADGACGSVADMVKRAITEKQSVIAPETARGYLKVLRTNILPSPFAEVRLESIKSVDVQKWISWLVTKGYSAKSIKNAVGVFTACYKFMGGEKRFNVKMPQQNRIRKHVPSISDVHKILDYFSTDPDMTAAIKLCAFASLRRGEACALCATDIDRKKMTIRVNKAVTQTPEGNWIIKQPKTASSVRTVPVGSNVLNALPKKGNCVNIKPSMVTNRFCRAIKELDVEPFSFHDLRHFYASLAHEKGVSDITIQSNCGWSSPSTMKDIYWGSIDEERKKQSAKLNDFIDSAF